MWKKYRDRKYHILPGVSLCCSCNPTVHFEHIKTLMCVIIICIKKNFCVCKLFLTEPSGPNIFLLECFEFWNPSHTFISASFLISLFNSWPVQFKNQWSLTSSPTQNVVHVEPCTGTETALFETKFAIFFLSCSCFERKSVETTTGLWFFRIKMHTVFFTSHFFVMTIYWNIYFIADIIFMFFMSYSWSCDVQGMI